MTEKGSKVDLGKREVLKKSMYVVPAILTLAAAPSFASAGSSKTVSAGSSRGRALERVPSVASSPPSSAVAGRTEQGEEDEGGDRRKDASSGGRGPNTIASR